MPNIPPVKRGAAVGVVVLCGGRAGTEVWRGGMTLGGVAAGGTTDGADARRCGGRRAAGGTGAPTLRRAYLGKCYL